MGDALRREVTGRPRHDDLAADGRLRVSKSLTWSAVLMLDQDHGAARIDARQRLEQPLNVGQG